MGSLTSPELNLVIFQLGAEAYAIPVSCVQEIQRCHRLPPPRKVPDAPVFFEGVIEFRGGIVPVLDLRRKFHLVVTPPARSNCYIVLETTHDTTALLVDSVSEVLRLPADIFVPPPVRLRTRINARYLVGVGKLRPAEQGQPDRLVFLLDIHQILNEDMSEILQIQKIISDQTVV
jgi:purine-binding chemotaxis protein CheW